MTETLDEKGIRANERARCVSYLKELLPALEQIVKLTHYSQPAILTLQVAEACISDLAAWDGGPLKGAPKLEDIVQIIKTDIPDGSVFN